MRERGSIWRRAVTRLAMGSAVSLTVLTMTIAGCQPVGDGAQPAAPDASSGSSASNGPPAVRKNPFATDNVTVAPQIEGRRAAPTDQYLSGTYRNW